MTFFYIANVIGYIRIACIVIAAIYSESTLVFISFYVASYALDAVDGPVARALNGTSKLGAAMDMITDRISTALLLTLMQDSKWYLFMMLDVSSHWIHMYASTLEGNESHKTPKDPILRWYYMRNNLFAVCLLSESYLCGIFLVKRGILFPSSLIYAMAPVFLLKQSISCLHLIRGAQILAKK